MSSQPLSKPIESKTHLGDGLYAEIEDGMIKLSCQRLDAGETLANNALRMSEHYVYIEGESLARFDRWRKEQGL